MIILPRAISGRRGAFLMEETMRDYKYPTSTNFEGSHVWFVHGYEAHPKFTGWGNYPVYPEIKAPLDKGVCLRIIRGNALYAVWRNGGFQWYLVPPDVFGRGHGEAILCATSGGNVSRDDLAGVIQAARKIAHWQDGFETHVVETRFGDRKDWRSRGGRRQNFFKNVPY